MTLWESVTWVLRVPSGLLTRDGQCLLQSSVFWHEEESSLGIWRRLSKWPLGMNEIKREASSYQHLEVGPYDLDTQHWWGKGSWQWETPYCQKWENNPNPSWVGWCKPHLCAHESWLTPPWSAAVALHELLTLSVPQFTLLLNQDKITCLPIATGKQYPRKIPR